MTFDSKAIATHSNWSEVYDAANLYVQQERWKETIAAFYRAIELNPSFFWSHHNLGDVLTQLQRWDEAIAAYINAIQLDVNAPLIYQKLGTAFRERSNLTKSIQDYRQVVREPEKYPAYGDLRERSPLLWQIANTLLGKTY